MSIYDDIRRDREAGTPGPWRHDGYNGVMAYGSCDTISCAVWGRLVTAESTGHSSDGEGRFFYMKGDAHANASRIARVPDMESALLRAEAVEAAADELAEASHLLQKACQRVANAGAQTGPQWSALTIEQLRHKSALYRYRAAKEGTA